MVKIRLSRCGRSKMPIYTLVAADTRSPRDGKFLEKLGQYNPHNDAPLSAVKVESVKRWVSKGAKLSDTVKSLLKKHKVEYK